MFSIKNAIKKVEVFCEIEIDDEIKDEIDSKTLREKMDLLVALQCFVVKNETNLNEDVQIDLLSDIAICMILEFGKDF
ncbi:TPA: hypothetical protein NIB67_005100 [Pseudomonas aeruginosa]|nr:hypothetical protein [Pseudomonas aeruginosa]